MQAAGRRTMPRPAVGVRPSPSFYAPAVPHGLRLCGRGFGGVCLCSSRRAPQGGPIGLSRSRRAARFAVVRQGLRGARLLHSRRAPQGRSYFIYVKFFPDVYIDSFTPHRPHARGHGGGAVFSRRERTIAHGHARTARFGGASGHSRGRISAPPRRSFATICPLAPSMVGGLGGETAAPDAGAGTRGDFDPPRQPTRRFFRLRADRSRGVSPPLGRERGDVPPLDARAPPLAAPAADSGGGLRTEAARLFPVTPMQIASACFCWAERLKK